MGTTSIRRKTLEPGSINPTVLDDASHTQLIECVSRACGRIAPMWALDGFVAVNPFWGFRECTFLEGIERAQQCMSTELLMPAHYYSKLFNDGRFSVWDLNHAARVLKARTPSAFSNSVAEQIKSTTHWLREHHVASPSPVRAITMAEAMDLVSGTDWNSLITELLSRFLSLYCDKGQSTIGNPYQGLSLFSAWREFACADQSGLIREGIPLTRLCASLPLSVHQVLVQYSECVEFSADKLERLLTRELFSAKGWASYLQHLDFERTKFGGSEGLVRELLAIRLGYSLALLSYLKNDEWRELLHDSYSDEELKTSAQERDLCHRYLCQSAFELRETKKIFERCNRSTEIGHQKVRPSLQAVFCIDVRSEVLRRKLEDLGRDVETYGFAGFFGIPFTHHDDCSGEHTTQFPVLLKASCSVHESPRSKRIALNAQLANALGRFLTTLRSSAPTGFNFVESFGVLYALKMAGAIWRSFSGKKVSQLPDTILETELDLATKVSFAQSFLTNAALQRPYAPTIFICGHRSEMQNNPFTAGYDCGACGGHGGEINARVMASILNDSLVRNSLEGTDLSIPADTRFISGVHVTTTDQVVISREYSDTIPNELTALFERASEALRQERFVRFASLVPSTLSQDPLLKEITRRSSDWSEVRPEWGLAGNTTFIAGRRALTRNVDLHGRVFLHEYDAASDVRGATLELILTAPVVVASWINLQYYGSTVAPDVLGAGDKVLHNVVGKLGVLLGGDGDIQVGLPLQAIHDGIDYVHEPIRLSVIVEAPQDRISDIVAKHTLLQQLIGNGWINLFAAHQDGSLSQLIAPGSWLEVVHGQLEQRGPNV